MERVEEWTGRAWLAVLATVVLFVGGHLVHYGLFVDAMQAVITLLFALLFLWRRDLTAPIVLHAVIDGWALFPDREGAQRFIRTLSSPGSFG